MKIPNSHPRYYTVSKSLQAAAFLIAVLAFVAAALKAYAHVDMIDLHTVEMEQLEREVYDKECEKAFERERSGDSHWGDERKVCDHLENHIY